MNAITFPKTTSSQLIRLATLEDVDKLVALENLCFSGDRINRRQFRWMITRANAQLNVCMESDELTGYVLVLFHKGTSLARLYSLAVSPLHRGSGLGRLLLDEAAQMALSHQCVYLRLEVDPRNVKAVALYERNGYKLFGTHEDYYQDHGDALRYQKRILSTSPSISHTVPYYEQTLDFSCGPASLIMAMRALDPSLQADRTLELQLWREATTIYMTSGHGGCSPHGLALAAHRRGFHARLMLNDSGPLFLDGVRRADKKAVLELVHEDFLTQIGQTDIEVSYAGFDSAALVTALSSGCVPLVLISSWRFNDNKAPHWVVLVAADDSFVYLHDPDVDAQLSKAPGDTQSVPVRIDDFERMIHFGQSRMQAAMCLCPPLTE
ncbi:GNAT family N-acetyltransferase/peptidase C39 family protein [Granulosicoccus antarcticus]|uniref:Mycothiol acetyltransferase n=1 Tax=Granulosicoccus antarcticus IMCC3135 TaxID=1192854 RepID=A0A2Z2NSJ1_9GAMM|nr:GNAT family N-acetyltransferase/peptidase C39 family protein [Granulosicoccus antarcticus]ASJ72718.1 Mycothiol acetyltransferase [Granulosicoccus antarcticus IMCC3135]